MIAHQAICVAEPVVACFYLMEGIKEGFTVLIVFVYLPSLIASVGDVIDRSGIFDAQWTCHEERLAPSHKQCQLNRPDPTYSFPTLLRYGLLLALDRVAFNG